MQLDREALEKLLKMNDKQLQAIILRLAASSGIDPAEFHINPQDIHSIRTALSCATDEDLKRITEQYEANKQKKR